MPQGFIDYHCHGAGEIERADVVRKDRNPVDRVGMGREQILWEASGLASED